MIHDSITADRRDLKKLPISLTTLPKIIFKGKGAPIILQIAVESSRPRSTASAKGERFRYRNQLFAKLRLILDRARDHARRGDFPILGNFHLFKMPSIPEDRRDTRHRRPEWMRAKRIARNDIRRAMSYREEPITRAVIYDCISVPFGRRRYIIRIPTRREFIYSIIIAYNR